MAGSNPVQLHSDREEQEGGGLAQEESARLDLSNDHNNHNGGEGPNNEMHDEELEEEEEQDEEIYGELPSLSLPLSIYLDFKEVRSERGSLLLLSEDQKNRN